MWTDTQEMCIRDRLGDVAMTASSLANQPFFIFNMLTFGLGSGAAVITAQYWGKREIEPIKKIITFIVLLTTAAGLLLTVVSLCIPQALVGIFSPDPDVIQAGADYMRIMCLCYPFFGFASSVYTTMRSVESVKVATVSNIVALVVNGSLNYILIFGKLDVYKRQLTGSTGSSCQDGTCRFHRCRENKKQNGWKPRFYP